MRRLVLPAAAVLAAVLAGACGGADGDDAAATTEAPASTEAVTSTGADATTSSSAPDTTAPSAPTAFRPEAREAIEELKAAWDVGDPTRARAIAPGPAVDALFTLPPAGFVVYGCDLGQFDTSTCNFRNRATGQFIVVSAGRSDPGWQVVSVLLTD